MVSTSNIVRTSHDKTNKKIFQNRRKTYLEDCTARDLPMYVKCFILCTLSYAQFPRQW